MHIIKEMSGGTPCRSRYAQDHMMASVLSLMQQRSNMSECRMSFVAVTSAQILGQHFCSLSTDALNLLLDIVQLCAHATADSFDHAGEVKWQQACSSDLL